MDRQNLFSWENMDKPLMEAALLKLVCRPSKKKDLLSSRKHACIILTPLNPTFIQ